MERQWSGRTDGGTRMQRWLIAMLRWTDVRVVYFFMAFVIPFYMIFNRQGYRSMRQYFEHRDNHGSALRPVKHHSLKTIWHIYRNHFIFGQVIIDRFAVYAGRKFQFVEDGKEQVDACFAEPGGFLILSSHTGNYELAGCTLSSGEKRVHALVYAGETETIMKNRDRVLGGHSTDMIPVMNDMSHIFLMNAAIDNGDVVSMPADRLLGSKKSFTCRFMGEDAKLPAGPFVFAAQKEVPVFAAFVMKQRATRYHLIVRRLGVQGDLQSVQGDLKSVQGDLQSVQGDLQSPSSLKLRAANLAKNYAAVLEEVMDQYPYQWFNYFDFWNQ